MKALLWFHSNTSGLPKGGNFKSVYPIEAAARLTNLELDPIVEVFETFRLSQQIINKLKEDKKLARQLQAIGLLDESNQSQIRSITFENQLIEEFEELGYARGDIMLAGSAMAHFTRPLVYEQFPRLAEWLSFHAFGLTEHNTVAKVLADRELVNPSSTRKPKEIIRSREVIERDIQEALEYKKFYQEGIN